MARNLAYYHKNKETIINRQIEYNKRYYDKL
jgi:hypothetical protein